ncbi:MAG: GGDEF domain-containing protein [Myxococcota bacterium]|nr:GGDEF domain-containing protein [Myxococcota bacterium]
MSKEREDKTIVSSVHSRQARPKNASLVQIYGTDLGRRFIITEDFTIGRDERNHLVLLDENVSRFHAQLSVREAIYLVDKESTNGTWVNDEVIEVHRLNNGDIIQIGSCILKYISSGNAEALYYEEIYQMMIKDGLTGVANRRYLDEFLERELAGALRHERPLSIAVVDADRFKSINDNHGHVAGDLVLKQLAQTINKTIRRDELLARYGGEEFLVVMPESNLEQATVLGEKIRHMVEQTPVTFENQRIPVTVSIGIAELSPQATCPEAFIQLADSALYRAKKLGRNQVQVYCPAQDASNTDNKL